MLAALCAFIGGCLISLSRQVNGRLSLSTTPLISSFWNHAVGFVLLSISAFFIMGFFNSGATDAPPYTYMGGILGVVFVASGSWLVANIGATKTAILIISGQMVIGFLIQLLQSDINSISLSVAGVILVMIGALMAKHG